MKKRLVIFSLLSIGALIYKQYAVSMERKSPTSADIQKMAETSPTLEMLQEKIRKIQLSPLKNLLAGKVAQSRVLKLESSTRYPSLDSVNSVAYNPQDPNQLASGSHDEKIRIWDIQAGESRKLQLKGHTDTIFSVAYNPKDPNQLASGSGDGTIRIWNILSGMSRVLENPTLSSINSVAYNPQDSNQLASGSGDGNIRIWSIQSGKSRVLPVGVYEVPSSVYSVAYNLQDPNQLASGSGDGRTRIWSIQSGKSRALPVGVYEVPSFVYSVVYNLQDPNQLASGLGNGKIHIWNIQTGEFRALSGHTRSVVSIAYNPQDPNQLASGSADSSIRIWDIQSEASCVLTGHSNNIQSVAYNPHNSNQLASSSWDNTIRIWDLKDSNAVWNWFNEGCPVDPSFRIGEKEFTTNYEVMIPLFQGIAHAMEARERRRNPDRNAQYVATPQELAYLNTLIFPRLPESAVEVLKEYVALEKRK